jgi:DNA-binding GntR family transcriptional regulator
VSSSAVETARQEWVEGHRRFHQELQDPARRPWLLSHLEQLTAELRKRIGTTFTLVELADTYAGVEDWAREALAESGAPGWPRDVTLVADEVFHLYARGATDYRP